MSGSVFDFLGTQDESAAPPEGGGAFRNRGFVGKLLARPFYKFWSREDMALYEDACPYRESVDYVVRGTGSGSYFYYFMDADKAKDAADTLEAFAPSQTWVFEMDTASILNFSDASAVENFGQSISSDCRMATYGSKKYRHEYHMLALPALVQALALRAGMVTEIFWHASEILDGITDEEFTDRLQYRMIGHFDATETDRELMQQLLDASAGDINLAHAIAFGTAETVPTEVQHLSGEVKVHYTYSLLWRRRAALWAALGENNPAVYLPQGMARTEKGKEFETSSEKLSMCLGVSTNTWVAPIWARYHLCKDIRFDATYNGKSGLRRLNLPVVTEIFADEAAATVAAEADKAEMGGNGATAKTTPVAKAVAAQVTAATTGLVVPEAWGEEARADWIKILGDEKRKRDGVLPNVPERLKIAANFACEASDVVAWWDAV